MNYLLYSSDEDSEAQIKSLKATQLLKHSLYSGFKPSQSGSWVLVLSHFILCFFPSVIFCQHSLTFHGLK